MNTIFTQIYVTTNYSQFSFLQGNRNIDKTNLVKILGSFRKEFLINPILVNEKFEIIDGQHRFTAAKQLSLPIYYYSVPNYKLKEVQSINSVGKVWKLKDFLDSYVNQGNLDYLKIMSFTKQFPKIKFKSVLALLSFRITGQKQITQEGIHMKSSEFQNGIFEIVNYDKSVDFANKISSIEQYFEKCFDCRFIAAILPILNLEGYDHDLMLHKISQQRKSLFPCANAEQYREQLENIYNTRNQNKLKFTKLFK